MLNKTITVNGRPFDMRKDFTSNGVKGLKTLLNDLSKNKGPGDRDVRVDVDVDFFHELLEVYLVNEPAEDKTS